MKPHLLFADRDVNQAATLPARASDVDVDLGLDAVLAVMASGDTFLSDVAHRQLFAGLADPEEVTYRQQVLTDFLDHPTLAPGLYDLAIQAIVAERAVWGVLNRSPRGQLHRSVEVLQALLPVLRDLRRVADEFDGQLSSPGALQLVASIRTELSDDYLEQVSRHLSRLAFRTGLLVGTVLDSRLSGRDYTALRRADDRRPGWWRRLWSGTDPFTYVVPPRDEAGARALGELRDRGLAGLADVVSQAVAHVLDFFQALRYEVGFYLGCLRLHAALTERGLPVCWPRIARPQEDRLHATGLYDVVLAVRSSDEVVSNDVSADGRPLLLITGANQGGKSTFLRSLGIAHLMAGAGMFAPAAQFDVSLRPAVYTHYRRGEDDTLTAGKFDEELRRMSDIVASLEPGDLVLSNESFAATNEAEGAAIAAELIEALLESRVALACVTHMFELAAHFSESNRTDVVSLRAERREDGTRTFRLEPAAPQPTSYGQDLYRQIFASDCEPTTPTSERLASA